MTFSTCVDAEKPCNPTTLAPKLRSIYRDQPLILAAPDLAPTVENEPVLAFPTVGAHLADLADAALDAALQAAVAMVCKDTLPPRLAVIAMGKCGARELNYVSDVDVIFVGEDADPITTRVAGEMMRLASEAFFEVDAAPWPEGSGRCPRRTLTPISPTTRSGRKPGSSRVLLKARPAVGDLELGRAYVSRR